MTVLAIVVGSLIIYFAISVRAAVWIGRAIRLAGEHERPHLHVVRDGEPS